MDREVHLEARVRQLELRVLQLEAELRDALERASIAEAEPRRAAHERHPSAPANFKPQR